jgi:hypothetical protein
MTALGARHRRVPRRDGVSHATTVRTVSPTPPRPRRDKTLAWGRKTSSRPRAPCAQHFRAHSRGQGGFHVFCMAAPKTRFRYEKIRTFRFSPVLPPHTFCMGATGFEHARVTSVESPNGVGGRSLAATPPLRGGRHRNRRGVSGGGAGGGRGGAGRSSMCRVDFCAAVAHIFCMGMTGFLIFFVLFFKLST